MGWHRKPSAQHWPWDYNIAGWVLHHQFYPAGARQTVNPFRISLYEWVCARFPNEVPVISQQKSNFAAFPIALIVVRGSWKGWWHVITAEIAYSLLTRTSFAVREPRLLFSKGCNQLIKKMKANILKLAWSIVRRFTGLSRWTGLLSPKLD